MMKAIWERIKFYAGVWCIAMVLGFCIGKLYTWNDIITDCKVLGMTRYGNLPVGCRVGEAYK
jgi:hypothetical protein